MEFKESSYEDIAKRVDELMDIKPDDLDGEALRGSKIFTELNRMYIHKSRKLLDLTTMKDKLEFKRKRYYGGKETAEYYKKEPLTEAILKSDIDTHMNIDPIILEMRQLVKECEMTVKFLEESKWQLKSRGIDITNAINYRRLMLGA